MKFPIRYGIIQNWDDMKLIWENCFNKLKVNHADHKVFLTEAYMNPNFKRERMISMMFEDFNVPATYISTQPLLILYSVGKFTGEVIDSGEGVTHLIPVDEGNTIPIVLKDST